MSPSARDRTALHFAAALALLLMLASCSSESAVGNVEAQPPAHEVPEVQEARAASTPDPKGFVVCDERYPDARPQMCTMNYDPVCASRDTGVRCVKAPCPAAEERKTYSNGCSACTDPAVRGWVEGACEP